MYYVEAEKKASKITIAVDKKGKRVRQTNKTQTQIK